MDTSVTIGPTIAGIADTVGDGITGRVGLLQTQKAEVIAQANASKAMLAKEVKSLRAELERVGGSEGRYAGADPVPDTTALTDGEQVCATHNDDGEARRAARRCDTHVALPCVLEYLQL